MLADDWLVVPRRVHAPLTLLVSLRCHSAGSLNVSEQPEQRYRSA
jgi:hypothetical protein